MNVVKDGVLELIQREYEAAKADHGPLASMHEGYAVLLEELEETSEALQGAINQANGLWVAVRHDDAYVAASIVDNIRARAMDAACEAIQVAAVARRVLDLQPPRERTKTP